jgi:hypothetical protein
MPVRVPWRVWVRHAENRRLPQYERAGIRLGPGLTAVVGANGQGSPT